MQADHSSADLSLQVPVIHDGKIFGMVSRADLLGVLVGGRGKSPDESGDRMIRDQLIAELRKQNWADPTEGSIVVHRQYDLPVEHGRIGRGPQNAPHSG